MFVIEWVTGDVILDANGDRDPSFWLLSLGPNGVYEIAKDTSHTVNTTGVFLVRTHVLPKPISIILNL